MQDSDYETIQNENRILNFNVPSFLYLCRVLKLKRTSQTETL